MSSRKKKKRSERKKRQQPAQPRRFPALPKDAKVIQTPPGYAKMSEVLIEFLEPYEWETIEELKGLVGLGSLAWNTALLPDSQRDKELQDLLRRMPPEIRVTSADILKDMIQRKLAYFADNKRMIASYTVTMTPTGPHIQILSSLDMAGPADTAHESPTQAQ